MSGLPILDVAIGLIFIYLTLSLAVTAANEMFAAWFGRRAWMLRKGLLNLLGDEKLTERLYEHPLVRTLYEPRSRFVSNTPGVRILFGNGPSYVPSRTFALALLDIVSSKTPTEGTTPSRAEEAIDALRRDTRGDEERLKAAIEEWFDGSMERVSGWYKRHTQALSLAFAAVVTISANADTLVIARSLWSDPTLRQAVVGQAEHYLREQSSSEATVHEDDAVDPPPLPPDQQPDADFADAESHYQAAMADLKELQLPLGWEAASVTAVPDDLRLVGNNTKDDWPGAVWESTTWGNWVQAFGNHAFGWLITTFAISLGAPFWFDMLNRAISIRGSGKAPEEKQKSPKEVPHTREPGTPLGEPPAAPGSPPSTSDATP